MAGGLPAVCEYSMIYRNLYSLWDEYPFVFRGNPLGRIGVAIRPTFHSTCVLRDGDGISYRPAVPMATRCETWWVDYTL